MLVSDLDQVLAIENAVQAYPWTRGNFCDALDSGYLCYVDDIDGKFCSYSVLMAGVGEAELLNIAVAEEYQRKGLGRKMMHAVLQKAREMGFSRVLLEVRVSNRAAIGLYRLAGFSEMGVRRNYYRNARRSEDAIVMECDLHAGNAAENTLG